MSRKKITAEELDRLFDEGSDEIDQYIDWNSVRRVHPRPDPVTVELPSALVHRLDVVAEQRGVTRQALIQSWLAEKLDAVA